MGLFVAMERRAMFRLSTTLISLLLLTLPVDAAEPDPACNLLALFVHMHSAMRDHGVSLKVGVDTILTESRQRGLFATIPQDMLAAVVLVTGKHVYFHPAYTMGAELNRVMVASTCQRRGFATYWRALQGWKIGGKR